MAGGGSSRQYSRLLASAHSVPAPVGRTSSDGAAALTLNAQHHTAAGPPHRHQSLDRDQQQQQGVWPAMLMRTLLPLAGPGAAHVDGKGDRPGVAPLIHDGLIDGAAVGAGPGELSRRHSVSDGSVGLAWSRMLLGSCQAAQVAAGAQAATEQASSSAPTPGSSPATNNNNNNDSSTIAPVMPNKSAGAANAAPELPLVLPRLQQLQLCDCLVDELALSALIKGATGLRSLQLLGVEGLTDSNLQQLTNIKHLTQLKIEAEQTPAVSLSALSTISRVTSLRQLHWCSRDSLAGPLDTDCLTVQLCALTGDERQDLMTWHLYC
eukprot:gene5416-5649_t